MKTNKSTDAKWLKHLAQIKWERGFKCHHCGHAFAYLNSSTFSRKCKCCKQVESVTANTAFAGMRISLASVMALFSFLQEKYIEWYIYANENPDQLERGEIRKFPARQSSDVISRHLGIRQEAGWRFIHRIATWMPRKYWKESNAPAYWYPNKDVNNKRYNALFNLLFSDDFDEEEERHFTARSRYDILTLLVLKKLPPKHIED